MDSNAFGRTALCGFIAGAVAFLVFHQGGFWALTQAGVLQASTWSMVPTRPFGVPQVVSFMFWTGLWGVLAAFVVPRLPMPRWLGWVLFAAVVVTLVNWFIVLPLKGSPVGGGFRMPGARHVAHLQRPSATTRGVAGTRALRAAPANEPCRSCGTGLVAAKGAGVRALDGARSACG